MNWIICARPLSILLFCLMANLCWTQEGNTPSISKEDSIQQAHRETQQMLQTQLRNITRSPLGEGEMSWSHELEIEVTRGGRSLVQRFWFNPKKDGPLAWVLDTIKTNEWLYFDPATNQLASLFIASQNGTMIPAAMATKMGLRGNQTGQAKKRKSPWKVISNDSLLTLGFEDDTKTMTVALGSKTLWQADGVNRWLSMQPVPGYTLPFESSKQPIVQFEQFNGAGHIQYAFRVLSMTELETPQSLSLDSMMLDNPERNLSVIAKEWAAEQKKQKAE